jgi:hypothetical protein
MQKTYKLFDKKRYLKHFYSTNFSFFFFCKKRVFLNLYQVISPPHIGHFSGKSF